MTEQEALRVGRRMAAMLGYEPEALLAQGVDLIRFGTLCDIAMNARPRPLPMPVELLTLPSTPTAGIGGPAGPLVPPAASLRTMHRPGRLARLLGAPVVRTWPVRIMAGAGLLTVSVATLGWLPLVAVVSMGFGPLAYLLSRELGAEA